MAIDPSLNSNLPPKKEHAVKIGEASKILGLHIDTLRRWEKSGKIIPVRTPGGTRLYSLDALNSLIPKVPDEILKSSPKQLPKKQLPIKNLTRVQEVNTYAHVYNKGVEKRIIFCDGDDYKVFQDYLKDYLTTPKDPEILKKVFIVHGRVFRGTPHQSKNYFGKVELIAYSLMPDHFHLLLHQVTEGSLQSFIRSLCTRYSMYFNRKYKRSGSLFEGPYKSVQIKDTLLLPHLTRYIHLSSTHSSYPEFLDLKETSWIKPQVVLKSFNKEGDSYKIFVEKYKPDQKDEKLIEGITLDSKSDHNEEILKRRNPSSKPDGSTLEILDETSDKINLLSKLNPRQMIPEFLGIVVIFFLLLAIGITNISASTAKSLKPSSIFLLTQTIKPQPTLTSITSPTPNPLSMPSSLYNEDEKISKDSKDVAEPKIILTIKINDRAESVNIRKKPTVNSEKIGQAKDKETFEFVSLNLGWYEVNLPDGSTGFISAKYIDKGDPNSL